MLIDLKNDSSCNIVKFVKKFVWLKTRILLLIIMHI